MNPTCSLCNGNMTPWLTMPMDQKTLKTIEYNEVYRCKQCSHGEIKPLPPAEKIPSFYELDKYYIQNQSHFTRHPVHLHDKLLTKLSLDVRQRSKLQEW